MPDPVEEPVEVALEAQIGAAATGDQCGGLMLGKDGCEFAELSAGAVALIIVFASAMIWIGTWIGMIVRSPDAVGGIVFLTIFPLSFLSNAFVPIATMPAGLEQVAAWNPMSALVGAIRELFGNPTTAHDTAAWPIQHPVPTAWAYSILLLALGATAALRAFSRRTSD